MKQEPNRASSAFTLVEVIIVIFVVLVLAALILPNFASTGRPGRHSDFNCKANFKNIGMASASWAEDHGDLIPSKQTIANGGWADFLTNADQGAMCWTNYAIMADNYGLSPEELICPADERQPALGFTNKFNNLNVSYFVGVSANDLNPQAFAAGDRNWSTTIISFHWRQLLFASSSGLILHLISHHLCSGLGKSPSVERSPWSRQATRTQWNRRGLRAARPGPVAALPLSVPERSGR